MSRTARKNLLYALCTFHSRCIALSRCRGIVRSIQTTSINWPGGLRRWVGFFNAMVILLPLRRALAPLYSVALRTSAPLRSKGPRPRSSPRSRWEQGEQLAYGPTPMGGPKPSRNRPPAVRLSETRDKFLTPAKRKGPKHLATVEGFRLSFEVAAVEFRGNSVRPA
jgi:hypothetical protein